MGTGPAAHTKGAVMSERREMAELINRHCEEHGFTMDIDELLREPHKSLIKNYFDALAYFKQGYHYKRLEDAGENPENTTIFIREKDRSLQYIRNEDQWIYVCDVPDKCYE